ncbi:sensor domain-containing protein [Lapillicoccus jejuensis]|uniref:PAS domain S-box-containing protein/diguanylate cyclase (GGDEF)-like protein n=1 Tax=Lapillicoccus jejuensis TaxID=402171 RepID=A0A542E0C1_9MICO|nr:EAL domain-containing protein [Lapillicoccus jejuensis]TQJ08790.1 PAS domain S-box-containing protein/diguanylate cyclase (GGDEF)-like protein [Lapillicoccus jejuensis]
MKRPTVRAAAPAAPSVTGAPPLDPSRPRATSRAAAPFVLTGLIGVLIALVTPHGDRGDHAWLVPVCYAVALVYLGISLRRDRRTWVDPVGPWLSFLAIMVARDVSGGSASPLGALVAIPSLWLALTGTRRDVWVSSGLTLVVFVAPILVIGPPLYSPTDWLHGLMWTLVTVFIAPEIHRVVGRVHRESARAREAHAEVAGVMRAAHLSSIIASDTHGVITSFSRGAELLLGHRCEHIVGAAVRREALHDPAEIFAAATELGVRPHEVFAELARRDAPPRTWAQLRADGTWAYVRLALTELRDEQGRVTGCLGIAIDSTASVEAERAVARSEATLRAVLQHLPDTTVLMLDEDLTVVAVGGEGAVTQGFTGAEGHPLAELVKPDSLDALTPLVRGAFDGVEGTAELRGGRTDAAHEVTVTPLLPGEDGRRALVIARDVSRERAHEREVLRAKERAERLLSDAPYGVALLTPDGVVLDVNEALCTMVGRPAGTLVGTPFAAVACPKDTTLREHLRAAREAPGTRVEADWSLATPQGREVHTLLSSRLVVGDEDTDDLVLVNVVDVSERRRYEQRLAHLADHDELTGLANRRRFDEELTRHLERCRRHGPDGALLMIDLDNFKEVNDTLGHAAGDQLIVSTAQLLRSRVRSTDVVARLGGDEFAVLLVDADRVAAEAVAHSIVDRVREHAATLEGSRRRVTASVGVVTVRAAHDHDVDILALADMTMYDAKDAGRDGVVVLDEDARRQPRTGARMAWKRRIEDALEDGAFELHLQPILDLRSGEIHSAEVLLRLADADELVPPGRFLDVAEQSGLMPALDTWVVERALGLLASLRRLDPLFRLEVNLSGHSIGDDRVERALVEGLRRHDVEPSALILEITETAAVADVERAREFADRMTALGCRFALDDFGAGFGSFYYLKHLVFDYVKIDGEFVANCHRSGIDRTILRSIVGIARDLGKQTVAEFVAEPAILEIVGAEGVDLAQGYDVGRPTTYDDFVARYLPGAATAA